MSLGNFYDAPKKMSFKSETMNPNKPITDRGFVKPVDARRRLETAASLHWFHWVIVLGSLLLTFFAWHISNSEKNTRVKVQFDREVEHVIELVQERMKKYEDALWSGVGLIHMTGGDIDFDRWKQYADSIRIDEKYPGINGIGVIHSVPLNILDTYLSTQRSQRPEYFIHPEHEGNLKLPISFVIPVAGNEKAVGLDMAHEQNRFRAAQNARASGESQITGPITLVQDNSKTPGFLFYTPFYTGGYHDSIEQRERNFSGLIYAPFVMKKLMEGTLEKTKRQVDIRLLDGETTLYDEHVPSEPDFDPDPLFVRRANVELFGRTWTFDIWSAKSFREATYDSQPLTILIGGILIDIMLVLLFISISRSSTQALQLADLMTEQLEQSSSTLKKKAIELERSNQDLEQYAYIASHDLQEPLRKVASFCELLRDEFGDDLGEVGAQYVDFAIDGATRMRSLVQDLLTYSKIGSDQDSNSIVDSNLAFQTAVSNLSTSITEAEAIVTKDTLPEVCASAREMSQLFQNLIGNSIKYRTSDEPRVHVAAKLEGAEWQFSVSDNGIGIEPEYRERVFGIFKRLHNRNHFSGTGIGLAICKRIVDRLQGRIWIESSHESGCKFCFSIPANLPVSDSQYELSSQTSNQPTPRALGAISHLPSPLQTIGGPDQ